MKRRGQVVHTIEERLAKMIDIDPVTGCHNWKGVTNRRGYGRMTIGSRTDGTRKNVRAHRMAYQNAKGEIPDGYEVCHRCDNPGCVNPDHLFAGTKQDNVDDRQAKGRNVNHRGSRNGAAKLTEHVVQQIRAGFAIGTSKKALARKYGVHPKTISEVVTGKTWTHVKMTSPAFPLLALAQSQPISPLPAGADA